MTSSRAHKIAIIAGDGIGKEVIPAGIAAIEAASRGTGVAVTFTDLPWGCDYYLSHGRMMDADGFERPPHSTRSISAPSARPPCPITSPSGTCCCRSGSAFSST